MTLAPSLPKLAAGPSYVTDRFWLAAQNAAGEFSYHASAPCQDAWAELARVTWSPADPPAEVLRKWPWLKPL